MGLGPGPFTLLSTTYVSFALCNGEWRPSDWEGIGGRGLALPPKFLSLTLTLLVKLPPVAALPMEACPALVAHTFYQEAHSHFNPRAGAGGVRMGK